MLLRLITTGLAILAWMTWLWIAGHVSSEPQILGRYSPGYFALVAASGAVAAALTASNFEPLHGWLLRYRASIGLLLVSVAGSLLLAEIAVRVIDPIGISYYEEARRYHLDKIADDELIFTHPANMDAVYQGARVQTNDLGFRDRPVGPKAPGELRILVLGDSVTFGWGVEAHESFPRVLEDILQQELQRPVRTINTGVGAYNTEQELVVARRYADRLQADAIVLLFIANDIEIVERPFDPWEQVSIADKSPPEAAILLIWHSWVYRLARHAWQYREIPPDDVTNAGAEGWQRSMTAMDQLGEFAADRNLPLFVFLRRYRPSPLTGRLLEALAPIAAGRGFTLVDTFPWFRDANLQRHMNSIVDVHPNVAGHRLMAEGMAATLLGSPALKRARWPDPATADATVPTKGSRQGQREQ